MTNEDIIRMANEARLCACKWVDDDDNRDVESLYDFVALVAAAIRARGLDNLNKEAKQNGEQL